MKKLLLNQRSSVNELAEAVDINPISVRHHVNKLEAEGLIESEEERHGVGRPRLVYSLTDKGMEQFPKRYLNLTLRLLEHLKEQLSGRFVGELFQEIAEDMADEITQDFDLDQLALEEKMAILEDVLTAEGFTIKLTEDEQKYYLIEASCPYHHVGETHPEICVMDQQLISHITSVPARRIECILNGDQQCKYVIEKMVKEKTA
jgi:predicted ArsR family transcriptional regulator